MHPSSSSIEKSFYLQSIGQNFSATEKLDKKSSKSRKFFEGTVVLY